MNRLAIFDCDGTLVDSQHNICRAMELCFVSAGLEPPERERTRRVVGLSLVEAMRAMLPEAEEDLHRRLANSYKEAFREMRVSGLADEPLYEGIKELLDRLEADGWLRQALSVLKRRGGMHDRSIRELRFGGAEGVGIGPALEHLRGVMTGTPVRQLPEPETLV